MYVVCVLLGLYDLLKYRGIGPGNLGQDFAIQLDVSLFQTGDEFAVGRADQPCRGVDADGLDGAVVSLFQAAVAIGVDAGFRCRSLRQRNFRLTAPHHALGAGKNILSAFDAVGSAFDSWHRIIWRTASVV